MSKHFLRFLVVGGVSFGIDFGLLLGLHNMLHVDLVVATTIGFLTGLLVNFALNKYWTFDAPRGARHSSRQAMLYGLLVVVNLVFTDAFIAFLASVHIAPLISKPISTGVIMVSNYILYQKVIFRPYRGETAP